jgi:hypothetical protein
MFCDINILFFWRLSYIYIYSDSYVTNFLIAGVIFSPYEYVIRKLDKYIDKIVVQILVSGIVF